MTASANPGVAGATPGVLFLVVGPSGAGKDTLIAEARRVLGDDPAFVFPRRTITRPADAGGEIHDAMSMDAFTEAEAAGAFALSWSAHTLAYGLPSEIHTALAAGRHVVVNTSRSIIAEAVARFPIVRVVHVTAPDDALRTRLSLRNRETASEQSARAARTVAMTTDAPVTTIVNDASIEAGGMRLVAALQESANAAR
jgi:phosphonate metabolism protein PhnN/1,5-bisphosphokinase (PRPP-forming)